jgi:hypothetical protein
LPCALLTACTTETPDQQSEPRSLDSVEHDRAERRHDSGHPDSRRHDDFRVLVFTRTAGERHASLRAGARAIEDLGHDNHFGVDVSADGDTTYVACSDGTLRIVDTRDRTAPALLGSVMLPGVPSLPDYNAAHSVVVVGTIAYVGNEDGLDEIDVSNAAVPVRTVRHDTGYFVSKVERAADGRIFAFAQAAGVFVFAPQNADVIFANSFD